MATYDNTYSRVVAWLKILLPLVALAILSTLFLVARTIDPAQNIPYADVDIDTLTREQRIGSPNYSGMTRGGAAVTLSAGRALPDPDMPDRITGDDIKAGIDLPSGTRIDILAGAALIDGAQNRAELHGGVVLTSSAGYVLHTEAIEFWFASSRISSTAGVTVNAPIGTLTAGQFVMTGDGGEERPYLLVFKGGVKLVYDPKE